MKQKEKNLGDGVFSLFFITSPWCNVLPSISIIFDVMVVSSMGDILRGLKYLELVLLAIVPLSLPAWKLWEKCKGESGDGTKVQSQSRSISQIFESM